MQLSQKQKTFFQFLLSILKSILNLKYFPENKDLIADVFPKLRAPKNVIR